MKSTLEEMKSWLGDTEHATDLQDRITPVTQLQQYKEKQLKTENNLRDLWNNIKHTKIQIIGLPEGEERERGGQRIPIILYNAVRHNLHSLFQIESFL